MHAGVCIIQVAETTGSSARKSAEMEELKETCKGDNICCCVLIYVSAMPLGLPLYIVC